MEFLDSIGIIAIASRLKNMSEKIIEGIRPVYEPDLKSEWFPVLIILADGTRLTIKYIAKKIGYSSSLVDNILKEMQAEKLIVEQTDCGAEQKKIISLSDKGIQIANYMKEQCANVASVVEKIAAAADTDLLKAIQEWERLLTDKSFSDRVKEERKERERKNIKIVGYDPSYKEVFRQLNEDWITSNWQLEDIDYKVLEHPKEYILDKGGHIFVALYKEEPVGVCALYNMADSDTYDYELAKYAVSPTVQGKGIGFLLCATAIAKVKELGGHKIFLESNTILKPAIHIYRKLGFEEVKNYESTPYARGNIQMELDID